MSVSMSANELLWWQLGVIYQIYPRSFKDSNGDGIGDLSGIIEKLDYLSDILGVNAIWLSPFYPSPQADFGYDVSNFIDVDPQFGTLADFDRLLDEAHGRNMQVIIDLVPNHTSDQHPWFMESRASRDNPKRDWYFWRDPSDEGGYPNNWTSVFGGSVWEWDGHTGQYYLHSFLPQQPDLNWRNPQVKTAMLQVVEFWLQRGVDGFRIDTAHLIMKEPSLRDNPPAVAAWDGNRRKLLGHDFMAQDHIYDRGHADIHPLFREIRRLLDSFSTTQPRYTVGEIHIFEWEQWAAYYGADNDELHMPYNFALVGAKWRAEIVRETVDAVEAVLTKGQWPNYVFSNHDEPRISSRLGPQVSRAVMMVLLTLRGTPTLYYGDELGMTDGEIPPHLMQDPYGKRVEGMGRDLERTPMQWSTEPQAGFTEAGVIPWLPVNKDYQMVNVSSQLNDPDSMLNFTRTLLHLRRQSPALHRGSYHSINGTPADTFVYMRQYKDERILIAINFAAEERHLDIPELAKGQVKIGTHQPVNDINDGALILRGYEGVVVTFT